MERLKCVLRLGCKAMLLLFVGLLGSLGMAAQVDALGFGELVLNSHLHQPMNAEIPLLLNASDDMKKMRIELATPQEYRQLGLQWQQSLSRIRVLLHAKHTDHPIIQLRSTELVHAPMLSIVLKAKKSGRSTYFKHYRLLLDPVETLPGGGSHQSVLMSTAQTSQDAARPSPVEDGFWARIRRYGPVQTGDNLSEIAYRLRVDKRFSNRQVMLSLYEKNLTAFIDGNINHLIKGVWLTIPSDHTVKSLTGEAAMQKLSNLLQRGNSIVKAATGTKPEIAAASGSREGATNESKTAAETVSKGGTKSDTTTAQQLRYSGKISLQGVNAVAVLKQGFDQQFDTIHQNMMSGKLQMDSLDQTVSDLSTAVEGVQSDIQRLQREIEMLKSRSPATLTDPKTNWQFGLTVLLLVLIGLLALAMLRKRSPADGASDAESGGEQSNNMVAAQDQLQMQAVQRDADDVTASDLSMDESSDGLADEVIQLLNQTEVSLSQCDFEQAEDILRQIDAKLPDSLKALALKAQLYHETDRHEERNALINTISEAPDEQRWERFCYFLPSHVWNACFGDTIPPVEPQGQAKD